MAETISSDNFVLGSCVPEDLEEMIRVYDAAFKDDYLASYTLPSTIEPEERDRWIRARFLKTFTIPEIRLFKISDISVSPHRIVAWVRWGFPFVLSAEEKVRRKEEKEKVEREGGPWPRGANLEVCAMKFGGIDNARERNVKWEEDYIVHLFQTDPAYQRRGLGKWLLSNGLKRCDQEGRKCHIEATKMGKGLYEKLGFVATEVIEVDLSKWGGVEKGKNWVMAREPRPVEG